MENNKFIKQIELFIKNSLIFSMLTTIFIWIILSIQTIGQNGSIFFNFINKNTKIYQLFMSTNILDNTTKSNVNDLINNIINTYSNFILYKNIFVITTISLELILLLSLIILTYNKTKKIFKSEVITIKQIVWNIISSILLLFFSIYLSTTTSIIAKILKIFINYNFIYWNSILIIIASALILGFSIYLLIINLYNYFKEQSLEEIYINIIKYVFLLIAILFGIIIITNTIEYLLINIIINLFDISSFINITNFIKIPFDQPIVSILEQYLNLNLNDTINNLPNNTKELINNTTLQSLGITPSVVNDFADTYIFNYIDNFIQNYLYKLNYSIFMGNIGQNITLLLLSIIAYFISQSKILYKFSILAPLTLITIIMLFFKASSFINIFIIICLILGLITNFIILFINERDNNFDNYENIKKKFTKNK